MRNAATLAIVMLMTAHVAFTQSPQSRMKPTAPGSQGDPVWQGVLRFTDGRTFVTDGGLAIDVAYAKPAKLPTREIPSRVLEKYFSAGHKDEYGLGGLTAALLVLLVVTGVYLEQFYQPNPVGARDSVLYIITRAPLGDWVRSIHYWAAGALVVTITAHLAHVFWRRSYLRPREVTWWAGVALAALVFLLTVTGTVLRADQEGFEALAIDRSHPAQVSCVMPSGDEVGERHLLEDRRMQLS